MNLHQYWSVGGKGFLLFDGEGQEFRCHFCETKATVTWLFGFIYTRLYWRLRRRRHHGTIVFYTHLKTVPLMAPALLPPHVNGLLKFPNLFAWCEVYTMKKNPKNHFKWCRFSHFQSLNVNTSSKLNWTKKDK